MKKLLLQICCAPCGTYTSEYVLKNDYEITLYFYNPNIDSAPEYDRRLEAVKFVADKFGFNLIIEPYAHPTWLDSIHGRESDPERGPRCLICYRDRLMTTAQLAKQKKFDFFGTSLTLSPYKDSATILNMGRAVAGQVGINFLDYDFKNNDGYQKSMALAKELDIYRQKYCGCEFTKTPLAE